MLCFRPTVSWTTKQIKYSISVEVSAGRNGLESLSLSVFKMATSVLISSRTTPGVHRGPLRLYLHMSLQIPLHLLLRHSRVNAQRLHAEFATHDCRMLSMWRQRWRRPEKTGICSDWSVSSERSYSSRVYLFLQRRRCLCGITKSCCRVWCISMGKARTHHGTFSEQICCPDRDVQHVSSASSVLVRAAVQRSLKISEMKLKRED